jgi:hypothetical protein
MKRMLLKLGLFVLAFFVGGAIVNVAVAWGTQQYSPSIRFGVVSPQKVLYSEYEIEAMTLPAARTALLWVARERKDAHPYDVRHKRLRHESEAIIEQLKFLRGHTRRTGSLVGGWPFASLDCTVARNAAGVVTPIEKAFHVSIRGEAIVLAAGLIPRGFAINTIFYAAILWGLFAAPGSVRRRLRRRRGLCPACAYPVGESETCTECGRELNKQKAETQKAETMA